MKYFDVVNYYLTY